MSIQIWFPLLVSQSHYPCQYNFGQSLCKCYAEICQSHSHSFMGLPLNSSTISVKKKKRSCRFLHEFKIQDAALLGRSSLKLLTHWVLTAVYDPAMPAAQDLIQSPPNCSGNLFSWWKSLPAFHNPRARLASDLHEAEDMQGLAKPSGREELLGL